MQTLHREFVPKLALSHPYLLYALLSIAASHSNALQPSKHIEKQALVYRQKTFQEYGKALQNITADNYETVLVTGTFLLALIPPAGEGAVDDEHMEWMYSLLKMSEGLRTLASLRWAQGIEKLSVYPLICRELRTLPPPPTIHGRDDEELRTPVGPLGTTPHHPNPAPTYPHQHPLSNPIFLPPPLMALFQTIVNRSSAGLLDIEGRTLIPVFHALSPIFLSLYYYHLNQDFYVRIVVLPTFLMPEFMQLIKRRERRALALIAWWFVLADLIPKGWWVGRCVGNVIGAIGRAFRGRKADNGWVDYEGIVEEVLRGAERILDVFERQGREVAAKSVFEEWEGVRWEEGPRKAEEWELGQLIHLGDIVGAAMADYDILIQS